MLETAIDQRLVDSGRALTSDDLTSEDKNMPNVLSVFMVLLSVGLPLGTLIYTKTVDVNADKYVVNENEDEVEFETENPVMIHAADAADLAAAQAEA